MNYQLRLSDRRSAAIEITREGEVIVRVPRWLPQEEIDRLVDKHMPWIRRKLRDMEALREAYPELDAEQIAQLRRQAEAVLPPLVKHWSEKMQVQPTGLKVTSAHTRYGSCSEGNRLCFSWRLMQLPAEAIEAVVVHELAHIRHKNHGPDFYAEVERYLPDYRQRIKLLKKPTKEGTKV